MNIGDLKQGDSVILDVLEGPSAGQRHTRLFVKKSYDSNNEMWIGLAGASGGNDVMTWVSGKTGISKNGVVRLVGVKWQKVKNGIQFARTKMFNDFAEVVKKAA